jgi:hypothetical protein
MSDKDAVLTELGEIGKVEFLAIITPSVSALKIDGSCTGGKLTLTFDDSQLPEAIKAVVLREHVLKVTLEIV